MTAKIDGTNGVLQQYDYQTPATGFSYTFAAGTQMLFMVPSGTLASGTITMPSAPSDGMVITFSSSQQITALTLQGNTGQSVSNAVTFLPAKTAASYVYRLANTTWYPCQTVPGTGSQLVSATAQNSTSGNNVDFTNIPSWTKRITVMFNGVSTTGSSDMLIQLGTSGGVEATGYTSSYTQGSTAGSSTTGLIVAAATASDLWYGSTIITAIGSNGWTSMGNLTNTGAVRVSAGYKAVSATLDRIRITVGGTNYDAGSINILYE